MFIGIEHTAIASPNPEKLAQWYVDHLGFYINYSYSGNYFVKAPNGSVLEIIPSEVDLCAADLEMARMENHLQRVTQSLKPVLDSGRFDIVLIDCAPSLGISTLNAFAACDGILVPLQCEYYALEGISMMNRVLGQLRDAGVNPRLEIFGVVMTMFDGRTKLSNEVVGEVRNLLGAKVFESMIPRSTKLAEAPSFGQPIIHYDKYSSGSAAYELLAQEVLERLNS